MAAILMLTPQIPYPPQQGTALRNWGILSGLASRHTVSLLTFTSPDQQLTPDPTLLQITEHLGLIPQPHRTTLQRLRDLASSQLPDLAQRLASAQFKERLRGWLATYRFDWILVEGLEMAPYLDLVPFPQERNRGASPRVVFDDHNCEYILQQRAAHSDWRRPPRWLGAMYSSIQWRRLRRYEAKVCSQADVVVTVSQADAEALRAIVPSLSPLIIPNGIDLDNYTGFSEQADLSQPAFVFTGTMDFRPNVDGVLWFADKVWPRVRNALPTAHFYIVGRRPHSRLSRLQNVPGITITGAVPDTRPYIYAATVYVAPLLVGGGTRLKLLESSAMGKAIVATTLAAEGFIRPERAMILVDAPDAFADACVTLARDATARTHWGNRARSFAATYDWEALLPPLLTRLEQR